MCTCDAPTDRLWRDSAKKAGKCTRWWHQSEHCTLSHYLMVALTSPHQTQLCQHVRGDRSSSEDHLLVIIGKREVYTLAVISVSFYCQLLGCCLSSPPYTRYYSYSPVRVRGQGVRYVRDSAPQLTEDPEPGYEEEVETPPPEMDNIIEDSPSVTTIPLSIDTIEEEDIFTSTADTIPENSLPTGNHFFCICKPIFHYFPLIADNLLVDNNCPMRENFQQCKIYLCKVVKNIMSIGFPCYSQ